MFAKATDLPAGVTRLPGKTIHLDKSPIVVANLKTPSLEAATKWGLDVAPCLRHADVLARKAKLLAGLWPAVVERPAREGGVGAGPDVDEDLYGGFVGNEDRRALQRLRSLSGERLAAARATFADARLREIFLRYRARNFPATLNDVEQSQWREHCAQRLREGADGSLTLTAFFEQIDTLQEAADERGQGILSALYDYAEQIAPQRE